MIQITAPSKPLTPEILASWQKRATYRLFDADGQLLYVGSSKDPDRRCAAHRSDKPWWAEVSRREDEWYAVSYHSYLAETAAIKAEAPKYNQASTPEYMAKQSEIQRRNAPTARARGIVWRDSGRLRAQAVSAFRAQGTPWGEARALARCAQLDYLYASGLFPSYVAQQRPAD